MESSTVANHDMNSPDESACESKKSSDWLVAQGSFVIAYDRVSE